MIKVNKNWLFVTKFGNFNSSMNVFNTTFKKLAGMFTDREVERIWVLSPKDYKNVDIWLRAEDKLHIILKKHNKSKKGVVDVKKSGSVKKVHFRKKQVLSDLRE